MTLGNVEIWAKLHTEKVDCLVSSTPGLYILVSVRRPSAATSLSLLYMRSDIIVQEGYLREEAERLHLMQAHS